MSNKCQHFETIKITNAPDQGCEECLIAGRSDWLYLRLCLECGHIGCCDNSPGKHTSQHFKETGHPMIRGFQAGETWAYCFIDDEIFDEPFLPLNKE